jgi:hypothetical protein
VRWEGRRGGGLDPFGTHCVRLDGPCFSSPWLSRGSPRILSPLPCRILEREEFAEIFNLQGSFDSDVIIGTFNFLMPARCRKGSWCYFRRGSLVLLLLAVALSPVLCSESEGMLASKPCFPVQKISFLPRRMQTAGERDSTLLDFVCSPPVTAYATRWRNMPARCGFSPPY